MLSKESLEKFSKSHQTSIDNVIREYYQHLFLSYLYQTPGAEKVLFKGGTALRLLLQNPRFSEDLDFTGMGISVKDVEDLLTTTLTQIEKTGIDVQILEAKETSGGYLGIADFNTYFTTSLRSFYLQVIPYLFVVLKRC